ncbi:hypothetical protein [Halomonas cupida]|uniref:hypothetical protein n=1 Tax=Halomonas cupida TaxID=44933 RepID=UPI003A92AD74
MADASLHDELRLPMDDELEAVLEKVRAQQHLNTLDEAAEWLIRRRLRKGTQGLTGRGRALYPAGRR